MKKNFPWFRIRQPESYAKSTMGRLCIKLLAKLMESRFRYRFFNPEKILRGVENLHGKTVLEIGCGTGFFTIPAARIIGDRGSLTAMDILSESVDFVSHKAQSSQLQNVRVVKGDALNTNLETESIQTVIIFGVVPAPMVPLNQLLPEMHRVLKPGGVLAVWPPVPGLSGSIMKTGMFSYINKLNGVYNFKKKNQLLK